MNVFSVKPVGEYDAVLGNRQNCFDPINGRMYLCYDSNLDCIDICTGKKLFSIATGHATSSIFAFSADYNTMYMALGRTTFVSVICLVTRRVVNRVELPFLPIFMTSGPKDCVIFGLNARGGIDFFCYNILGAGAQVSNLSTPNADLHALVFDHSTQLLYALVTKPLYRAVRTMTVTPHFEPHSVAMVNESNAIKSCLLVVADPDVVVCIGDKMTDVITNHGNMCHNLNNSQLHVALRTTSCEFFSVANVCMWRGSNDVLGCTYITPDHMNMICKRTADKWATFRFNRPFPVIMFAAFATYQDIKLCFRLFSDGSVSVHSRSFPETLFDTLTKDSKLAALARGDVELNGKRFRFVAEQEAAKWVEWAGVVLAQNELPYAQRIYSPAKLWALQRFNLLQLTLKYRGLFGLRFPKNVIECIGMHMKAV